MERSVRHGRTIISGRVIDGGPSKGPVRGAEVVLLAAVPSVTADETPDTKRKAGATTSPDYLPQAKTVTDDDGRFTFAENLDDKTLYRLKTEAFGVPLESDVGKLSRGQETHAELKLDLNFEIHPATEDGTPSTKAFRGRIGRTTVAKLEGNTVAIANVAKFEIIGGRGLSSVDVSPLEVELSFTRPGRVRVEGLVTDKKPNSRGDRPQVPVSAKDDFAVSEPELNMVAGKVGVALQRSAAHPTLDQALWIAIRNRSRAIAFDPYRDFIDQVLCADDGPLTRVGAIERRVQDLKDVGPNVHGVGTYQLLKTATEVFLLLEAGVSLEKRRNERLRLFHRDGEHDRRDERLFDADEESNRLDEFINFDTVASKLSAYLGTPPQLPYISRVARAAFPELAGRGLCCDRVVSCPINEPVLIELIWSYWHEEGMLAQTMNAISRRFQNVRAPGERDPLAHFELDPLRRVGNLLWGHIQDEINLLSVKRRAYEYSHHYGLSLYGRAAGSMRPADNRSKFLEAFHNLLHLTSIFYKEDNDTTVIADGFPLLNALKEVHLILAQGAHNQFGDLPWTARAEMMVQEYILARPEIREFLQSRIMVPYKEAWMPQVDTMKTLQGWSDVTITHFRDLGVYGEQILLSIRYSDWIDVTDEDSAKNWARYWRPEIQGYLHAYRAVTGVDLTNPDTVDATVPAVHLQKRLTLQQRSR